MPIYEYQCRKCEAEFEALVLPTSEPPACPECNSQDLEQLLSGFAVSSKEMRKASEAKHKRAVATGSQAKDAKVAQDEHFIREHKEHRQG